MAARRSVSLWLAAGSLPLGLLLGVGLAWIGTALRSPGLLAAALLLLATATPAALGLALRAWFVARFALDARAAGLAPRQVVRGALGAPCLVRGHLDGVPVRLLRDRVEVERSAPGAILDLNALRAIARGAPSSYACARAAAVALIAAGATRLVSDGARVQVWGAGLIAREVVAPALALACAPARVRVRRPVPASGGSGCPYCHVAVGGREPAVRCRACDVRQHSECWREHGGCAIDGCSQGPTQEGPARRGRPQGRARHQPGAVAS